MAAWDPFSEIITEYGPPTGGSHLAEGALAALQGRLPEAYVAFLRQHGIGLLLNGYVQLVDPSQYDGVLKFILGNDQDIPAQECCVVALGAFGNMVVWHNRYFVIYIGPLFGDVTARDLTRPGLPGSPEAILNIALTGLTSGIFDTSDDSGNLLFKRALKKYGPLQLNQIYAPKLHPALGGPRKLDNFRIASAPEALGLMAQATGFQLKDASTLSGRIVCPIGG